MIYTSLLNIAIFQGLILGLVILKSKLFNSQSNKYLAYLLFTLSIKLLNYVFEIQNIFGSYPLLQVLDNIEWVFLIPAFFHLFIINRTNNAVKSKIKTYWVFIPFAFSAALNITNDLDHVAGLYTINDIGMSIIGILGLIQLLFAVTFFPFFPIYSYFMIRNLKDPEEEKWITILLTIVYFIILSWLITALTGLLFNQDISFAMSILALAATFIIHWISYFGIYKYKLAKNRKALYSFLDYDFAVANSDLQIVEDQKSEEFKESITADNPYFQKLEMLCKEENIFEDCTLNREKVAEKLGISAGYVSQIVNTITGDNFANYINQYRVEAVKKMLSNPEYDNYTLLTMGLESGFTSKTTFYNAFKKVTGQTPNEYKNTVK